MTNFTAFNPSHTQQLLESFAPGMSQHITPIKYEAITPDIFAFLFRTSGQDGEQHYFVSLEFDYIKNLADATAIIEKWHGTVTSYLPPVSLSGTTTDQPALTELRAETTKPYFSLLAKVVRPMGNGYWAASILIRPGDSISAKINGFSLQQQANIRTALDRILKRDPADGNSDINTSDISVSLYVNDSGGIEFFYK